MKKDKDCKHSVRFAATDEKAPVQSIYINRETAGSWTHVDVTIKNPVDDI